MIRVEMDLISARTFQRSSLVTVDIANDGTGTQDIGHYTFSVRGRNGQLLHTGRIENWPRKAKSAGELLAKVMKTAYPNV